MNQTYLSQKKPHVWKEQIDAERADMQGLIVRGYDSLNAACYIFLKITEPHLAKEYFNALVHKGHITTAQKLPLEQTEEGDPIVAVQIAFTSTGLKQLDRNTLESFSREFKEGMSFYERDSRGNMIEERSELLGDTENNHPSNWWWGNSKNPVDCLLLFYALDKGALEALINEAFTVVKKGVSEVYRGNTFLYKKADPDKEHFGFRDGISQPIIKGLSKSADVPINKQMNPGEFILGHENEYNNYSPSPCVDSDSRSIDLDPSPIGRGKKDLGKNGTYLVFRQIEQHVEDFWDFQYEYSRENGSTQTEKAIRLASKMIGRWPEGHPLVTYPEPGGSKDTESLNDFYYTPTDKDGIHCPLGAHIRRTNPRDQVHTGRNAQASLEMSNKHRILRRGRIYGEPLYEKMNIECMLDDAKKRVAAKQNSTGACAKKIGKTEIKRGLHFICLVSDIARQFEFVQSVWANTATFGDLCNEVDPVISPRPTNKQPNCHEFTTPQNAIRNRYTDVPMFTTVVGGAYFFMPGIKALKYIIGA